MLFVALTRCFALACFVAVAAASAATYDPACEAGIEAFREIQGNFLPSCIFRIVLSVVWR